MGPEKVLKGPAWLLCPLQCHPARELVVHAATLFGDLQSFMKQALDQAEATQALWHTLSSRLRVRVWPESHQGRSFVGTGACGWLPHLEASWWLNQVAVRSLCRPCSSIC